ncbi:hypothetical protein [Aquisphaera insulae]|uniref:hypothetical protein n=1 Tax=Aquisphaera insulae TaxID=2712864 RepID=UPI0013EDE70A|nr:hypothetical protein [Aquisphaera insulae]
MADANEPVEGAAAVPDRRPAGRPDPEPFPKELSLLLIVAGVGGILLPGPVGMPFLVVGGLSLWPRAASPADRWFRHAFPRLHREGRHQLARFLRDLESRYPADSRIPTCSR